MHLQQQITEILKLLHLIQQDHMSHIEVLKNEINNLHILIERHEYQIRNLRNEG